MVYTKYHVLIRFKPLLYLYPFKSHFLRNGFFYAYNPMIFLIHIPLYIVPFPVLNNHFLTCSFFILSVYMFYNQNFLFMPFYILNFLISSVPPIRPPRNTSPRPVRNVSSSRSEFKWLQGYLQTTSGSDTKS